MAKSEPGSPWSKASNAALKFPGSIEGKYGEDWVVEGMSKAESVPRKDSGTTLEEQFTRQGSVQ